MRIRFRGFVVLFLLAVSVSAIFAQQRRGRNPAPAAPAQTDLRITYRSTTAGQSYESSTMIKGKRERTETRMGYGSDIINITQCDLKRTIQASDKTRKYIITPMKTVNVGPKTERYSHPLPTGGACTARRSVNYTTITDTGERRNVRFTAVISSRVSRLKSFGGCLQSVKQRMETEAGTSILLWSGLP